jgi:hypothetical protein
LDSRFTAVLFFGFASGAALVAFTGKLYVAVLLLAVALLCLLRLKRGRVSK